MMATHVQAEKRVIVGFGIHAAAYVIVVAALAALNLSRNPDNLWFLWVAAGWGLGVVLHGAGVFLIPGKREEMIERTEARMERREARQADRGR